MLSAVPGWGQVNTATIYANVADSSGAAVPNAQAALKNPSTGVTQRGTSNTAGEFTFTYLPIGTYDLTLTAAGFQTYSQTGLTLTAGRNLRLQITLPVGEIRSTITISGEQKLVNAVNVQQLTSISTQQVRDLPVARMDWTNLLSLSAGTSLAGNSGVTRNGLQPAGFTVMVDGTNSPPRRRHFRRCDCTRTSTRSKW